jgi:putative MATE family efflux protein
MALQTSYNLVDLFWVGKVSTEAIAAVSLAGVVFFIILAIGQTLGSGTVALVARSYGARQYDKARHLLSQSILLTGIMAVGFGIIGALLSRHIMSILGARAEVLDLGTQYLRIVSIGFVFDLLAFSVNFTFRGAGDMKTPMWILLAATLTNMALDPLMILGIPPFPRMGVAGAAFATAIAQFVGFTIGFAILLRGKSGLKFRIGEAWPLERTAVGAVLSIGIPVGISYGLMSLSGLVVFRFVARFGSQALAAFGVGLRILQVASLPVIGVAIATTTLIGQNLGAREKGRAGTVAFQSMGICSAIMIGFGVIFFSCSRWLVGLFCPQSDVVAYGSQYLRIASFYLLFIGLSSSMTGAFRGSGYTMPPMYAGLIKLGILVALGYIISEPLGMGLPGVWWAMVISYGIEFVILAVYFSRGTWKLKRLGIVEGEGPIAEEMGMPI